ncbi:ribosomal RNA small subunit methyltransferase H [Striga asiatica]|uniref:Ribosomal RNA small subunit methyltransferase H n=1 Tax=Striga asiatica TaxID=4170 RepID=A0A5A7Q4V6_STRAF|nr:ribosomal RNA small subunit methyltransferase H [Striga asiatica]
MEGMLHRKSMFNFPPFHGFWKLSQVCCSYLRSSILRFEQEVQAVQEVREVMEGWKIEHRLPVSSCYRAIKPYIGTRHRDSEILKSLLSLLNLTAGIANRPRRRDFEGRQGRVGHRQKLWRELELAGKLTRQ